MTDSVRPAVSPVSSAARPYRGWRIVAGLFLACLALFGVGIYSFIILSTPLGAQHGWSAAQTGAAVSAMWFAAPVALFAGAISRRVNLWTMVIGGLLVQAVAMFILPHIADLTHLFMLRLFMGLGKIVMVTAVPIIVARWFSRRFATAMAIIWAGGSAGGFILSPVTEALDAHYGWQTASTIIAAFLVLITFAIWLLQRGPAHPHEIGLRADGDELEAEAAPDLAAATPPTGRTILAYVNPVIATLMLISVIGIGMASIAVLTQEQALLEAAGISSTLAATFLGVTAAGSLAGSASIGFVLDRYVARRSGLLIASAMGIGLAGFALLHAGAGPVAGLIAALSCGFAFGAGEVLWITLTKRQFGTIVFATTYGGWYFALQLGYAAGGGLGGWGFESFGPVGFLLLVAAMYIPAALSSVLLRAAAVKPGSED